MNPKNAEILTNPHPCGHIVYPYTDEAHVAEAVAMFAGAGLRKGEAVVLIMTANHFQPVLQRLKKDGFDTAALKSSGQLICEDAKVLLSSFLFDGIIDEHRFKTIVGNLIDEARSDGSRPVRLFGEMVDLLWRTDHRSTQRLEELWNEVIDAYSVPLLCAYSLAGTTSAHFPTSLVGCHSHALT